MPALGHLSQQRSVLRPMHLLGKDDTIKMCSLSDRRKGDLVQRVEHLRSGSQGVCEIRKKCTGLINLGLAVAMVTGAFGLTVFASSPQSTVCDLHGDASACGQKLDQTVAPLVYRRMEIPEAGLSLDIPIDWQQLDQEPAWSPIGDGDTRIGVSWYHLLPVIDPEAILLPRGGLIAASTRVMVDWGSGRQYLVEDYGPGTVGAGAWAPALSVELHTVVTVVDGESLWAYDLHAVAQSEEELVTLKPVLDAMLRSMNLSTPTAD